MLYIPQNYKNNYINETSFNRRNSTDSLIRESVGNSKDYILNGTFTEFGVKNRNERIYNAPKSYRP
jgi:hypothetical protein